MADTKPRRSKKKPYYGPKGFLLKEFIGYDVEQALAQKYGTVKHKGYGKKKKETK